jgi:hypothetical protein
MGYSSSGLGQVAGSCKQGHSTSSSVQFGEFPGFLATV